MGRSLTGSDVAVLLRAIGASSDAQALDAIDEAEERRGRVVVVMVTEEEPGAHRHHLASDGLGRRGAGSR